MKKKCKYDNLNLKLNNKINFRRIFFFICKKYKKNKTNVHIDVGLSTHPLKRFFSLAELKAHFHPSREDIQKVPLKIRPIQLYKHLSCSLSTRCGTLNNPVQGYASFTTHARLTVRLPGPFTQMHSQVNASF